MNTKITIYTIPPCPYCKATKAWLENHNLKYEEISVPLDKNERTILDQFAQHFPGDERGVPVIVVEKDGQKYYFNDEENENFQKLVL